MDARCILIVLALFSGCSLTGPQKAAPSATMVPGQPTAQTAMLASTSTPERVYRWVCRCDMLNIREGAGVSAPVVGWLKTGSPVVVTGVASGVWVEIASGGWVHGGYLCP